VMLGILRAFAAAAQLVAVFLLSVAAVYLASCAWLAWMG
jgi:hypothetical protein